MIIIVPGKPIAKKRPRFARRGKFVVTYNDQETEEGKWLLSARGQITRKIQDGPIVLNCNFEMPIPKGQAKKILKGDDRWHVKKPDLDNLLKFVKDCLNGEAWADDSQVVSVWAEKYYSDDPRTIIQITEASPF
jgi:Holliday junction resolvase RusA-like endonuclease